MTFTDEEASLQIAMLAHHLAGIEEALHIAETMDLMSYLGCTIRWHIQQAEAVAPAAIERSRRIIRGQY